MIVGTGFMGDVHARAVRAAGGTVAAVVSRSADQAAAAATRFGAVSAYTSLEQALTGDVDVVHICTPNQTHRALAHEVIEAGVHVICEKPLATSVSDAQNLEAAATAAGVVHAIPFAYRFYGSVREARARILSSPTTQRPNRPRQLPSGLALPSGRYELAGRPRPRRSVAGFRRHRRPLV